MNWDSGLQRFRPEDSAAASPSFRCAALFTLMSSNISEGSFSPRWEASEGDEEGEEKRKKRERGKTHWPEVFKEVSHPYSGGASREAAAGTRTQKVGAKENNRPDQSQHPPLLRSSPGLPPPSSSRLDPSAEHSYPEIPKSLKNLLTFCQTPPSGVTCKGFYFSVTLIPLL